MKPVKAKELIQQTALRTGESKEDVEDVVRFFWKTVRRNLTTLTEPTIQIANFGEFRIKEWALDSYIQKTERILERIIENKRSEKIEAEIRNQLILLHNLKRQVEEEKKRELTVKEKRRCLDNQ
jgi:5-bromo-4-chloroindolyl phosphate hydrolysis protein